jgi:hypothetical protein
MSKRSSKVMFLFESRGFGELLWLAKMNSGLRLYADQMRGNHVICTKNHQVGVKISWPIRELAGSSKTPMKAPGILIF